MRKKNETIYYDKSSAKIFAIAGEVKKYPSSKQFPDCDDISPAPTVVLGHRCFHLAAGVGLMQFRRRGFN